VCSADVFDEADEFVEVAAAGAGEADESMAWVMVARLAAAPSTRRR